MTRLARFSTCVCRCRCYSTIRGDATPSTSTSSSVSPAEVNDEVNAFVSQRPGRSPLRSNERASASLSDIRISIKDNLATQEDPTSCASDALDGYTSPYDATVVSLLRAKGARIVGKTNMDEFGMGSFGIHSSKGAVRNPLDRDRVAGGSSSGAAASVAAGYCDVSLGSDTGGSIRLPASFTGTIGFKPSYGLLSRHGLVAYASSLDTVGILGRKVQDVRRVFDTCNLYDRQDPTAIPLKYRQGLSRGRSSKTLRIGIPMECFPSELTEAATASTRHALGLLRDRLQAEVISVSIPNTSKALSAYYTIASAEAGSNLARYDGIRYGTRSSGTYAQTRTEGFGSEVVKRIITGTYALTADAFDNYFLAAQRLRNALRTDMDRVFRHQNPLRPSSPAADEADGVDILLYPSAISHAPLMEETRNASTGVDAYVQDVLTVPASLAGLPAMSFPFRTTSASDHESMPVGVQLVSQWGCDDLVLDVASQLEELSQA